MIRRNIFVTLAFLCALYPYSKAAADTIPQPLPFNHDWTNIGQIVVDDNWNGVPGIIGYRGDGLTGGTGVDPQTVLLDGSLVVDVNANQLNPNSFLSGGVTEFEIPNPVVALQGSGTARAPSLVITVNTIGQSNINISYRLRDIDGSGDNSLQPVALQYRMNFSGPWQNMSAAFVPDASGGPNQALKVTPISVTGPVSWNNQPVLQFRIITTDALGNDEWIGIDNISVTSGTLPTSPAQAPGTTQAPPSIPGNSESNRGSLGSNYARNVNLFSGEFVENAVDLRVKSRGLDVIWARRYGSRNSRTTAMGNGWDYSYNINIHNETAPGVITLHDGDGREDFYVQTGPSTWVNDQFARELRQNGDLSYTLAFSDGGHWHFLPIDGSPFSGKCDRISDRNNNSMFLFYDGGGRLVQLMDTVGRPYQIFYDPDGFIQAFIDYTGRAITYQHYQNVDPGGSFGDLRSVTTPTVNGTPTCNDFPSGKTMSYTYSEGLTPAQRNSNLLTIRDPKGQIVLVNTYTNTNIPTNVEFDHVTRQVMGPAGNIDYFYVALMPEPANNHAVVKTIINDRMGHVKEVYFNAQNLGVIDQEFTGIAPLPDSPTGDLTNRPGPPLRPTDPLLFETRYEYDAYGRAVRVVDANLNEELFSYMLPGDDPSPLARANMAVHSWLPGPLGGAQPVVFESFSYVPGTSYMAQHTDGRGNSTFNLVDPLGNVLQTFHRGGLAVDDWTYNAFGQMTNHTLPDNGSGHRRVDTMSYTPDGYVQTNTMDSTGSPATTTYSYDARGNVTSQTDPCGNTSLTDYNELDQAMRMLSNEINLGGGQRIETLTYYDANNNVVRVDVQNRDENGNVVPTNTHWSTISEYGLLNERTGQCQEVGVAALPCTPSLDCAAASGFGTFIKTDSQYNPNGGVTLTRSGVATDGSQPTNVVRTLVDERDLTYRVISAEGDPFESTAQFDYNGNRGVIRLITGVGSPSPHVVTNTYDGYDRLVSTLDPMGNTTSYAYDANHNPVTVEMHGELLDVPGSGGNVLLSSTTTTFDPMDLATARVSQHFDANSGLPIGDGANTTQTQYAPTGQVMAVIDDAGNITATTYTTFNRPASVTDPKGNRVEYSYDPCGNIVNVTDTDFSDIGNPPQSYASTHIYNGLNQSTSTTDAAGTTTQRHDSRGNLVVGTNGMGVETRYAYDGLSRKISSIIDMDANGANGSPADIVTLQTYDAASRLLSETDSKGNSTTYAYDALNRKINTNHADATTHSASFDVFGNVTQSIDANGSVVTYTYDALTRGIGKNITPAAGVSADTTFETYAYDGLSRLVRAEDNDSVVTQDYDSLSRVTREITNGVATTSVWDANGNKTSVTYPGGRSVQYSYDGLSRLVNVSDNFVGGVGSYLYVGSNRVERRLLNPPNIVTNTTYNPARMIAGTRSTRGPTVLDDRTYQWSPTGNKTQRRDIRLGGPRLTHDYIYDAADRMIRTIVSDPLATVLRDTTQTLDEAGNRSNVSGPGTLDAGAYTQDSTTPNPADFQVNQYTTTSFDSRAYDNNGNLKTYGSCLPGDANNDGFVDVNDVPAFTTALLVNAPATCNTDVNPDGQLNGRDIQNETDLILNGSAPAGGTVVYDYRNRMVRHIDSGGNVTTYAYDTLGRRIQKVVSGVTTNYYHDGWQVVEERDGGGVTVQTYVWGNYVDELLTRRRLGVDYYYVADDMYNIMAVTNAAGNVIERYEYGDYGQPINPSTLVPVGFFGPGSEPFYGFQGRAYDLETGWYYFRTRYLDPRSGRYTTRVAIGMWGDAEGNTFSFCGNNPWSRLDPIGRGFWFYRWWWWRWYCYGWWKWWCPWRYCGYYCYYWWWWYPYRWWLWWWWPYQWYGYYYWWWSPYWAYCWYPYRWSWWPYRWWWWWYPYRWYGYHCGWWWWWYSWRCWVWYPYGGTWWWWWYPHCWGYYYWWNWWWWNPWRWYWGGWWWYTYGWWGYYYGFYWCYPYRWYWTWYHWWWWPCGWWWQPYGWWGCYYDWWWCWYPYYWWNWWWGWWYPYGWWGWYYGWYWWWYPWGCWYWWWWYPYGWYSWWWGWYWWWWWWPYGWWWWWPYRWWWWWCL